MHDSSILKSATMGKGYRFLPVQWEGLSQSAYKWSNGLRRSLQRLSQGSSVSGVHSGHKLAEFISQVADQDVDVEIADGVPYYFDECLQPTDQQAFFEKTLPRMGDLALRLPELLVEQNDESNKMGGKVSEESQNSGEGDDAEILLPLPLRVSPRAPKSAKASVF